MNALAKLDRARIMLAEARTLPEVKKIRDLAEAAKAYARAEKMGIEAQNYAGEIVVEATRRMGEFLIATADSRQRDAGKGGDRKSQSARPTVKLSDLGISKDQSSHCQAIARLPREEFQKHITAVKEKGQVITTGALVVAAKEHKRKTHLAVHKVQHFQPETESPEKVLSHQIRGKLGRIQDRKSSISVSVKIANGWTNLAIDYLSDSEVDGLLEIL